MDQPPSSDEQERVQALLQDADLRLFPIVGKGSTAVIRQIPHTDLALKVFSTLPCLEWIIPTKEGGAKRSTTALRELYDCLLQAQAPLPKKTMLVDLTLTSSYQPDNYPDGIVMKYVPQLTMGVERWLHQEPFVNSYVELLGRLHAKGIVISPEDLRRAHHHKNQALYHIPALVDEQLILFDWTNLVTIDQVLRYKGWESANVDENYSQRAQLLLNDLREPNGFGELIHRYGEKYDSVKRKVETYLDSFCRNVNDQDFSAYYRETVHHQFREVLF